MAEGKRLEKTTKEKTTKMSKEPKVKVEDYEKHLTERLGENDNYVSKENREKLHILQKKTKKKQNGKSI
jgi:hypothetical protein